MVEVFLEKYENLQHKLENGRCCDLMESTCREECSNNIWLCVSRMNSGIPCDLVVERINGNTVGDIEVFDKIENRFKNPFINLLPESFTEVSFFTKVRLVLY